MAADDITARAHDNSNDGSTLGGAVESDRLGPGIWKITAVTVAGAFMTQLSTTMVNVSLSSLGAELHASLSAIQWVTSGYLLALALMLPLNGWLVERIGEIGRAQGREIAGQTQPDPGRGAASLRGRSAERKWPVRLPIRRPAS